MSQRRAAAAVPEIPVEIPAPKNGVFDPRDAADFLRQHSPRLYDTLLDARAKGMPRGLTLRIVRIYADDAARKAGDPEAADLTYGLCELVMDHWDEIVNSVGGVSDAER